MKTLKQIVLEFTGESLEEDVWDDWDKGYTAAMNHVVSVLEQHIKDMQEVCCAAPSN